MIQKKRTKRIALFGMLSAVALVLGYVESLVPAFFMVPGMKLGLTNIVVLLALYAMDEKAAVGINGVRIVLSALLFGSGASFLYSLSGFLLSTTLMILLKKTGKFSMTMVSMTGGISHNAGQILMAVVLMKTTAVGWYFVILWFSGMISGILIGLLGSMVYRKLPRKLWEEYS